MRVLLLLAAALSAVANWWSRLPAPVVVTPVVADLSDEEVAAAALLAAELIEDDWGPDDPADADWGVVDLATDDPARRLRVEQITKPLTTTLVIGMAAASGAPGSWVVVATIALALCLVGDVALMPAVDNFILGLGAFLLGHVAFIVLFARYGLSTAALAALGFDVALVVGLVVGRRVVAGARRTVPALTLPVCAYLAVILSMLIVGWATGRAWVIIGTTAFVISDSILGTELFVQRNRWLPLAVMGTYHVALFSLALSLW